MVQIQLPCYFATVALLYQNAANGGQFAPVIGVCFVLRQVLEWRVLAAAYKACVLRPTPSPADMEAQRGGGHAGRRSPTPIAASPGTKAHLVVICFEWFSASCESACKRIKHNKRSDMKTQALCPRSVVWSTIEDAI